MPDSPIPSYYNSMTQLVLMVYEDSRCSEEDELAGGAAAASSNNNSGGEGPSSKAAGEPQQPQQQPKRSTHQHQAKDRFHIELLFSPGLYPCFQTEKERIYESRLVGRWLGDKKRQMAVFSGRN
jgi:hypothetical protein